MAATEHATHHDTDLDQEEAENMQAEALAELGVDVTDDFPAAGDDEAEALADGTGKGEDPDTGQIFDIPRVAVIIDDTDPTIIKLSFAGSIELDRAVASDVQLFNTLRAGHDADLRITAAVASSKTTHRRDSEGNVDAVVTTKSLTVHSLETD